MADTDLLRPRGVPYAAVVDATGTASGGTSSVAQLAAKGIRAICQVDATGLASSDGTSTVAVLASRGLLAFAAVDENGVSTDDAVSTADVIRRRGIRPMVPVNANGIAATGSATMLTLAQRGLDYFCPVDESGAAVDLTPVPPNTIRARAGIFTFTGETMTPITGYSMTAQAGSFALVGQSATIIAPATYQGPGDVAGYSGALGYWGLRGYTAAVAATGTQNAIDIYDQAGANPLTVKIKTDGSLDVAAINAWVTAHSPSSIIVSKLYDQSGNNFHLDTGSSTLARPLLILSGAGFPVPVMAFNGAAGTALYSSTTVPTRAHPFTVSGIFRGSVGGNGRPFSNGAAVQISQAGAGLMFLYAGAVQNYSIVPDGQWGATQAVFNTTASTVNSSNATTNSSATPSPGADAGAAGLSNGNGAITIGARNAGSPDQVYEGNIFELMIIPSAVTAPNQAAMATNQRAYGGGF